MSEHTTPNEVRTQPGTGEQRVSRLRRLAAPAGVAALLVTLGTGFGVVTATGQDGPARLFQTHGGMMGGHGGMMGGHGGMMGERGLERMFDRLDATPEQRDRIWKAIDSARTELRPMMREMRDQRERGLALLTGATIDPAAVEAFRAEQLAKADAASKRVAATMVEIASTLTPEQRTKLAEHIKEHTGRRPW